MRKHKRPLVAAFILDTNDDTLKHYIIRGLVAKIVTGKMFGDEG